MSAAAVQGAARAGMVLAGAVLAGGRSCRMGRDKALLRAGDGQTFLDRAWALVSAITSPCWVCCAAGAPRAGYPCLEDEAAGEGPARALAGALAAAGRAGGTHVLTLSCDLPFMRAAVLARLVEAAIRAGAGIEATLFVSPLGRVEMLAGVYAVSALQGLRAGLCAGERSLFRLVPSDRRLLLPYAAAEAPFFFNCNTPADAARARAIFGRPGAKQETR